MRLVAGIGAHGHLIHREGDLSCIGVNGLALGVGVADQRKVFHAQRQQFVGPFQVVVTHGRLVDLHQEQRFIGGVGQRRVQVLGRQG